MQSKLPKQYVQVRGKRVIQYALETLCLHNEVDEIVIVADSSWRQTILEELGEEFQIRKPILFANPGKSRQESIYHGLQAILFDEDGKLRIHRMEHPKVLIHDAARPLLSNKLIHDCFAHLGRFDGVMPCLPMKDTIYFSEDGGQITHLLPREKLFAGQSPEAYDVWMYYEANKRLLPEQIHQIHGSSEVAVLAGMHVGMIEGDENNFKLTTPEDMRRFEAILETRSLPSKV
jgi:2-C-methyl-D-erythritol 4-phosphate cytidylyltransferase